MPVGLILFQQRSGKTIDIERLNQANGWKNEAACWNRIAIKSE